MNTNITIRWPAFYTVRAYCICGDAVEIHTDEPEHVENSLNAFMVKHRGSGHGPCDSRICLRARRKRERRSEV